MASQDAVTGLVIAARDGDAAAWNALVERYLPLVVSVARRYRLKPEEVADVSQTLWLRLVEHLHEIREPRSLPGWIATTTRNEAVRYLKSRNKMQPVDPMGSTEFEDDDQSEVDEHVLQAERRQALRDGIAELRPQHRELLMLLLTDPPTPYDEISRRLGIPKGSIGPTRARCLDQLRRTAALAPFITEIESRADSSADRS